MKINKRYVLFCMALAPMALTLACSAQISPAAKKELRREREMEKDPSVELATFGGGCFWCTEAVFQEIEGVKFVKSGYTGGHVENPTYRQVCDGQTGHAEVIQIGFDPEVVDFAKLVEVHLLTHDPTTLNRQGADSGTQYRSAIFYHNDEQRDFSNKIIAKLTEAGAYRDPIVTEVTEFSKLYEAEDYHQNYFANNSGARYCQGVIQPKMNKFRKQFADLLKDK